MQRRACGPTCQRSRFVPIREIHVPLPPVLNRGNPAPLPLFLNFHAESSISLVRMNVIGSRLFGCERLESPGYETRKSCSTGSDIVSNNFPKGKTPGASRFLNRAG